MSRRLCRAGYPRTSSESQVDDIRGQTWGCQVERGHVQVHGATTPVIAKLEKPEALDHLDAILASADGVMIARGT